ncbi:MAG TPA: hypothetical protein PK614_02935 [Nitrospira sp.]|nr:hypothetical protein [Nitrospira sp.]
MALEMVLNELSLAKAANLFEARAWMSELIKTSSFAASHGVARVLHSEPNVHSLNIADGYPLARWRNDEDVPREERQYFRSLITKSPLVMVELEDGEGESSLPPEYLFDNQAAKGLGFAFEGNRVAISLQSKPDWNKSILEIIVQSLSADGDLEISNGKVHHASHRSHITENLGWIKRYTTSKLSSGRDLVRRRGELLPSLEFCSTALEQLEGLTQSSPHFIQIVKHLLAFQEYCENWTAEMFVSSSFPGKITKESGPTLQLYGAERTFVCPDGRQRLFVWHARITPEAWRIYFEPQVERRALTIAYIGPHLSTVRYPT